MRVSPRVILTVLAVALWMIPAARAAVPTYMNVQGKLTDAAGAPVPAGLYIFTFRIFDQESGGTKIWPAASGENQTLTVPASGLWIASVGELIPLTEAVFQDTSRWLEMTVNNGINPAETLPRVRLKTSPYAFRASAAQTLGGSSLSDLTSKFVDATGDQMTGPLDVDGGHIQSNWTHKGSGGAGVEVENRSDGYTAVLSTPSGSWGVVAEVAGNNSEWNIGVAGSAQGIGNTLFGNTGVYGFASGTGTENYGVYGTTDESGTENYSGYFAYGDFMVTDPATPGNLSVTLPDSAISAREILDEPGLAHGIGGFQVAVPASMADLVTATITTPADGYVLLIGSCGLETFNQTTGGFIYVQIDETAGGSKVDGYWSSVGSLVALTTAVDWAASVQRVYFKSAGTYTFRMEGYSSIGSGTQLAYNPRLTALFVPSSYGAVFTVADLKDAGAFEQTRALANPGGGVAGVETPTRDEYVAADLRDLELRAARTAAAAEKARCELLEARSRGARSPIAVPASAGAAGRPQ